jgi:hypothetical protein
VLCFAAGTYVPTGPLTTRAFLQQWHGTNWTSAAIPLPAGATASELSDVECVSTAFCLAVGNATVGSRHTLIEQWDGSTWTVAPVSVAGSLTGVDCADATHCAAVGASGGQTLVEQWNGASWTTASGAVSGSLRSVSCADASHCTAVGVINLPNSPVLQWSGATWTTVNGVVPAGTGNHEVTPTGVSCTAFDDCALVGHYRDFYGYPLPYAGHWDGVTWSQVAMPSSGFGSLPADVACTSSTDCTSVGTYYPNHGGPLTAVEHWDGSDWTVVTSPNPPTVSPPGDGLERVACVDASHCFAVGSWIKDASTRTLIERFA